MLDKQLSSCRLNFGSLWSIHLTGLSNSASKGSVYVDNISNITYVRCILPCSMIFMRMFNFSYVIYVVNLRDEINLKTWNKPVCREGGIKMLPAVIPQILCQVDTAFLGSVVNNHLKWQSLG